MQLDTQRRIVRRRQERVLRHNCRSHRRHVARYGEMGMRCGLCQDIPFLPNEPVLSEEQEVELTKFWLSLQDLGARERKPLAGRIKELKRYGYRIPPLPTR